MDHKEGHRSKEVPEDAGARPVKVREMLPDAPDYVGPDLLVPPGYRIAGDGIYQVTSTKAGEVEKLIAHAPILIAQKLRDRAGRHGLVLAWRAGWWRKREVFGGGAARSCGIVRLANLGFPVNQTTARDLMTYLAAFEAANFDTLPVKQSAPLA